MLTNRSSTRNAHPLALCLVTGVATAWLVANGVPARAGEFPAGFFADAKALPSNINASRSDSLDPRISTGGLELYFGRATANSAYVYVAERNNLNEEFGDPVRLGSEVNFKIPFGQSIGSVSEDGFTIYFYGSDPVLRLYTATRNSMNEPFGDRKELVELNSFNQHPCTRATLCAELVPFISPNGLELYFSSLRSGNMDLYKATRDSASDSFGDVTPLTELNSRFDETAPVLSNDGLTLFFSGWLGAQLIPQDRTAGERDGGFGQEDIWVATRASLNEPFDNVMNLGPAVNSDRGDEMGSVTADWPAPGSTIYFTRKIEEAQGSGFLDGQPQIWQATWYVPTGADLDGNDQLDITDVDFLHTAVRDSWTNPAFDLDQSGTVDFDDLQHMIETELGTLSGDANLDGAVDFPDFLALSASFGQDGDWAEGDFDADGTVLFPDFLLLSTNFGKDANVAAAIVPEPAGVCLAMFGVLGLIGFRRRR